MYHMSEKKIFGVPVDGQHECYFKRDELLFIQNWKNGDNLDAPMFYTKKGRFTVCTSLELAKTTMPTFERFQKRNVLNKLAISRVENTPLGYKVFFKDTDITTRISSAKHKKLDLYCPIREDRFIIVTKDKIAGYLPLEEVCYIDLSEPKKDALRIHTKGGVFFMSTTFGQYREILGLTQADNWTCVNIGKIKHIELLSQKAMIHFVCSDYKTTMNRRRLKFFQRIVPIIET